MPTVIFIILLFLHFPLAFSSGCADGEYQHDNMKCCLCAAGERLKSHCIKTPDDRQCEHCDPGTYNIGPNSKETCQPCTSCSHEIANLEEDLPCERGRDRTCRCKEGHFCSSINSNTGNCLVCQPCTKCANGVKEYCTLTSDAICDDKNLAIIIALPVICVLLLVAGGAAYVVWKKRKQQLNQTPKNGEGTVVEMRDCKVEELEVLLPDIVDVLGWKDMKDIATRSGIKDTVIESCVRNHPGDNQEQTLQLLKEYVQAQGRNAPEVLIRTLNKSSKKRKAEKVSDILCRNNQDGPNPSA